MYSSVISTVNTIIKPNIDRDYREDLINSDLEFNNSGDYLIAGEIINTSCWILHISVIITQLNGLLNVVIPVLAEENITFRIAANELIARKILNGSFGAENLGKIISIQPENNTRAIHIAKKLVTATNQFKGPDIPGCFGLGGCLHISFENLQAQNNQQSGEPMFRIPKGISWPFSEVRKFQKIRRNKFLAGKYLPVMIMKSDVKGKVFKCINFTKILSPAWCLIKQGKSNMCSDDFGRHVQDRLRWQVKLNPELQNCIEMPSITDVFIDNRDLYLGMDFIEGITLNDIIDKIYKNEKSHDNANQIILAGHLISISEGLLSMHNHGVIHRDLNPENFLINKSEKLFFIDMELAFSIRAGEPNPPFVWGTPGFMSPEQLANKTPTIEQDIYGLGVLISYTLTGLSPSDLFIGDLITTEEILSSNISENGLVNLLIACMNPDPGGRQDLKSIIKELALYKLFLTKKS